MNEPLAMSRVFVNVDDEPSETVLLSVVGDIGFPLLSNCMILPVLAVTGAVTAGALFMTTL
jgi:hypothetical protein